MRSSAGPVHPSRPIVSYSAGNKAGCRGTKGRVKLSHYDYPALPATLIRFGTLITAAETLQADILIEGEKITAIGEHLETRGAQVIDASGKLVMPGGVDVHTHFDLPMFDTVSSDDHYTGHKAAAFGGTTTVIDFVSQEPAPMLHDNR